MSADIDYVRKIIYAADAASKSFEEKHGVEPNTILLPIGYEGSCADILGMKVILAYQGYFEISVALIESADLTKTKLPKE